MFYVVRTFPVKLYVPNMIDPPRTRREEYTEATRRALLDAARGAFASVGFKDAGIEHISRAARVTRGAFYHHFEDKRALFDAVVTELQAQAAKRIEVVARSKTEVWDRLEAGIDAYLDVCLEPDYARIVVQEGPVVLGPARSREIEEANSTALLAATIGALLKRGELASGDVTLTTQMIDALICRLALLLPEASDADETRAEGRAIIDRFLSTLRPQKK